MSVKVYKYNRDVHRKMWNEIHTKNYQSVMQKKLYEKMREYKMENPVPQMQPTLTLAEVKEHVFGTPYTREFLHAPVLKEHDYGDLVTVQTSPKKREKNLKQVAGLIRKFHKDPTSITLLTPKELKHGLRLLGVLPTSSSKASLVVLLNRSLLNTDIAGGLLSVDFPAERQFAATKTATDNVPGCISVEDAIKRSVSGIEPPPKPKALMKISNVSPKTLLMGMTEKEIVITNCSQQSSIDVSGAELIANFVSRSNYKGQWSREEATRSFFFPEGCTLPPRSEIHILCGNAGKKHLGNNTDIPGRVQRMCWDPEINWFNKIWSLTLLDSNGRRLQLASRRVLIERCRSVKRALASMNDDKKLSDKNSSLSKVMSELDAELRFASGLKEDDFDLPHPKADYELQVNGLHCAITKQRQQTDSLPLKSLSEQGISPDDVDPCINKRHRYYVTPY